MSSYVVLIGLSLIVVVFLYLVYSYLQPKARERMAARERLEKNCKAAFDTVYAQSSSRPKYAMKSSYGFPAFTITFSSNMELDEANKNGLNQRFSKEIEELCRNSGTEENPFQVD